MTQPHASDRPEIVHTIQCPQCGAPIEGARPGEMILCAYCGTRLRIPGAGPGQQPAGRVSTQNSAAYVARLHEVKRLKPLLAKKEAELAGVAQACAREKESRYLFGEHEPWIAVGILLFAFLGFLYPRYWWCWGVLVYVVVGAAWAVRQSVVARKERPKTNALVAERQRPIRAERDRLAQRITELEAEIAELGSRL